MSEHKNIVSTRLIGRRVAILATDGFELSELRSPKEALLRAGAVVEVVSIRSGNIKGWQDGDWRGSEHVDRVVDDVRADEYDALMIPGGVINPDKLRMNARAVAFVRAFVHANKPVGAICHGPWVLVEADVVRGRKVTSYASVRTDLQNAGAEWLDQEVVVDQGLITSRSPQDLPAFNLRLLEQVEEAVHANAG